jgi:hypothetical protein
MLSRKMLLPILGTVTLIMITAAQPARAQLFGQGLDFGPLETGVLPDGTELPDLTGDTLDPDTTPPPKRAGDIPLPADVFDSPATTPAKKKKKTR